jgi:phenylalanyl-tRNA synthetase beta chain
VRDLLVDRGFQEAITYSFVDPKAQQTLFPQSDAIVLPNPISVEMSAMRVSLFPGLVQAVVYNQNRQQPRVRLFEQGLRFIKDENAENGIRQEPCWPASSPATRGTSTGMSRPVPSTSSI